MEMLLEFLYISIMLTVVFFVIKFYNINEFLYSRMDMLIAVKRFHTHNKFHLLDYRCIKSTIKRKKKKEAANIDKALLPSLHLPKSRT